ncbi:MAG: pyridoxamine 5'-phosphate oxidase family protein [Caldilinea sp.]
MPTSSNPHSKQSPVLAALFARFAEADACWFSSVRQDGRAHLAPIWHVVYEDAVYVVTQRTSVRSANIRSSPAVSLALADTSSPLIIEGLAHPAEEMRTSLRPLFLAKYAWDITADAEYDDVIRVIPHKVMAWGDHGEGRWKLEAA